MVSFPKDFGKHWKILFAHPRDFTPVCSSELLELGYRQKEFKDLDAQISSCRTNFYFTEIQNNKAGEALLFDITNWKKELHNDSIQSGLTNIQEEDLKNFSFFI